MNSSSPPAGRKETAPEGGPSPKSIQEHRNACEPELQLLDIDDDLGELVDEARARDTAGRLMHISELLADELLRLARCLERRTACPS
jgi:hypothetical protein